MSNFHGDVRGVGGGGGGGTSTDMPIDLDEVVNVFEGLHPRMMQLQSLLYKKEWSCCGLIIK